MKPFFFNLSYLRKKAPWDSGISPPELLEFIAEHPPGRAIDLGCGTGTNVITLAQHGWQVSGVDFAPRAIKVARRKAKHVKIDADLRVGDVTKLRGVDGKFNLALDMGCFHNLDGCWCIKSGQKGQRACILGLCQKTRNKHALSRSHYTVFAIGQTTMRHWSTEVL